MGCMVLLHREDILLTRVEAAVPVESSVDCYKNVDCFEQSVSPAYMCLNNRGDLPLGDGRTTDFFILELLYWQYIGRHTWPNFFFSPRRL